MTKIPLTKGMFALVDDADAPPVSRHKWFALTYTDRQTVYAAAKIDGKTVLMHRFIMNPLKPFCVDHRDHDGLNNTRRNLRVCTQSQNLGNQRAGAMRSGRAVSCPFKGVTFNKRTGKYHSFIQVNGKQLYLGSYAGDRDAAEAYDRKAREVFGAFAYLNFPGRASGKKISQNSQS